MAPLSKMRSIWPRFVAGCHPAAETTRLGIRVIVKDLLGLYWGYLRVVVGLD